MASSLLFVTIFFGIAAQSVLSDPIGESKGPLCFFCSSVENPDDCETIITCSEHEQCYTERYISKENHEFFRLGCKAEPICQLLESFQGSHGTTGTNCLTCCKGKYCNQNLCRNNTLDRIQCYTCNNVLTPHECEGVTTCDYDEVCAAEEIITDEFEIRYNVKCKQKQACALLGEPSVIKPVGKRADELCDQCCTTPFCNRDLCGATNVTYTVATTTTTANPSATPVTGTAGTSPPASKTDIVTTTTPSGTRKVTSERTSLITSNPVTPKTMSNPVTTKPTLNPVTTKPTSNHVTPKTTSNDVTPKTTSNHVTPKTTSNDVTPKTTSNHVTPKTTSNDVTPKTTSNHLTPKTTPKLVTSTPTPKQSTPNPSTSKLSTSNPATTSPETETPVMTGTTKLSSGGLECFQCKRDVFRPSDCTDVHTCKSGESCMKLKELTDQHEHPIIGVFRYQQIGCCSTPRCYGFHVAEKTSTAAARASTVRPTPATTSPSTSVKTAAPTTQTTTAKPTTTTTAPTRPTTSQLTTKATTSKPTTSKPTTSMPTSKAISSKLTTNEPASTSRKPTPTTKATKPSTRPSVTTHKSILTTTKATPPSIPATRQSTPETSQTIGFVGPATCYVCPLFDASANNCTAIEGCLHDEEKCFVGRDQLGRSQSLCLARSECDIMSEDILHHRQYYHEGVRFRQGRCCDLDLCNQKL